MERWENPRLISIGERNPHASFYKNSAKTHSLNGEWCFRLLESPKYINKNIISENTDKWDKIEVPSVWQLHDYDQMWYTDVLYQFPIHPPFVPLKNPTGVYRKEFILSDKWLENKTIISFGGVDSAYDVYVNNEYVGFRKISRLPGEFDISDKVHEGKNEICVCVYKYSDGTYLEDQDQWWLSGIFRDVNLINEPYDAIINCIIKALPVNRYKDGELSIEIEVNKDTEIEYRIIDVNNEELLVDKAKTRNNKLRIKKALKDIRTWNAEDPYLYRLKLKTKKHSVEYRFGFREIKVIDGVLCVNGQRVIFKGVNHHDYSPDKGRYISKEICKDDVLLMKQHNINAIRTSHYPSIDDLYDLADEYGLYVIDETDLECDGAGYAKNYEMFSDNELYEEAYVQRCIRMVKRDINHPSIMMYSLGNESGFGKNFMAMRKAILSIDKSRLIHYEGDTECKVSDVYSTMYSWVDRLKEIAKSKGKPHVHCEYCHAMGNGPGNLKTYADLYKNNKRLSGGFIWEWYDHGIEAYDEAGRKYYKYGGDFNEFPHNGNFCIDGLLKPDRSVSVGLLEYKQVNCPVEITYRNNKLYIKNMNSFISTDNYLFAYEFKCLDKTIKYGEFSLDIAAGKQKSIEIACNKKAPYLNSDIYLNVYVRLKNKTIYAKKNYELGRYQFIYKKQTPKRIRRETGKITKVKKGNTLTIQNRFLSARFDLLYGELLNLSVNKKKVIEKGPEMTVFRANIDNDMYKKDDWLSKYYINLSSEQLEGYEIKEVNGLVQVTLHKYFGCLSQTWGYYIDYIYEFDNENMRLKIKAKDYQNGSFEPDFLPRLGFVMNINKDYDNINYYALGPKENYSDSKEAAYMDVFRNRVDDMHEEYVYPQENGHHQNMKWLCLMDNNEGLMISAEKECGFNVSFYSDEKLEKAKHTIDLIKDNFITLHLDYAMSGLGSNSCGQDQLEKDRVKRQPFELDFMFSALKKNEVIKKAQIKYEL